MHLMQELPASATNVLLQLGVAGVFLLALMIVVRYLFLQLSKSFEERLRQLGTEHAYERKRAEELVAELKQLNSTIQDKTLTTLMQATNAVSEVLRIVRDSQR